MPSLKWIKAEGRPQVFPVYKKITSIGRAGGNDVAIREGDLADYHAQVVFDGKEFTLSEVDRKGELRINGKKKRRGKVLHGDRLTVGDVELQFSIFEEVTGLDEGEPGNDVEAELSGLRKLHEFSERLMRSSSLDEQLAALMDAIIEVTHAGKGFLILLQDGEPKVTVARNLQQQNLPDAVQHLSDSILQKVIESRKPLIVSDALHDTLFKSAESVMNLQLASVMCAPLIAQNQLLGVLYVGNDNVRSLFEEKSLDVLTIFAGQASLILQNALLLDQLKTDRDQLAEQLEDKRFGDIIGTCPPLLEVFNKLEKVASTNINVLVTGETGTGKELIAREIHRRSPRKDGPFVVVNCGAIPENLMESELFGHVRGAFTGAIATRNGKFQSADGGTLFLDEIGEMPVNLQVKLLRALQEKIVMKVGDTKSEPVDIRVVAATNRELEEEIQKSNFREDLYYRLNVVNLHLPPLRERGDDVAVLAKFLLSKYAVELGSKVKGFTPNALIALKKYDWPGNVRQLENRIKKAIVLCDKTLIGPEDMDLFPEALKPISTLAQAREDFQRRYILEVLERNNGNRTKTARDLGVDPRTIFRYLEREPDAPEPATGAAKD
ncbi:MAG: sigma 54-interacting transcriptional regulator [Sandaracinaceae bacterium]|nr:MAG: GAF domain-containing protein [Sandaracinaceae bacterium]HBQ11621.1 Fis family transcriptional regulator [Myxococcales bacterium]